MFKQLEFADFGKLRAFYFVTKYGSLLKAANYLHVTPAAISIRLKKLEAELQIQIFDRHPNKLTLTDRGRLLFKEADNVFEALTRMQEAISGEPDPYSGKLIIGIGSDLAGFFAPQIAVFSKRHPRLRLRIVSKSSGEVIPLVLEDEIDIGFTLSSKVPRGIEKKKLFDSKFCLIFPHNHPLSKKKHSLADVARYRLITHGEGSTSRQLVNSVFSTHGIEMEHILEASTCAAIIEFVRFGLGVGFVHNFCRPANQDKKLGWWDIAGQFRGLEVSLVYRKSTAFKPARQALIDALINSFTEMSTKSSTAKVPR